MRYVLDLLMVASRFLVLVWSWSGPAEEAPSSSHCSLTA